MKSKKLLFGIGFLSLTVLIAVISVVSSQAERRYNPKKSIIYNEIKGAFEWLASVRNNQITGELSLADIMKVRKEISQLSNQKSIGIQWQEVGPNNVGGRTRAILIDKDNSNLLYAGGVSGGLFKSTTGGTSWEAIPGMSEVNICCIAQNPINGYLYVGTGEKFANVDYVEGTPGFVGSGLYESIDGGATWHIFHNAQPTANNSSSLAWAFVNRIAFDPISGRLYAGTNGGLKYWDEAKNKWVNPINITGTVPNTGNVNTVVVGSDRSVAVSIGNRFRISPNGDSATFVTQAQADASFAGANRIELAFAPSNPNYIYAVVSISSGLFGIGDGLLKGVYRSEDKGVTWTTIGPGGAPAFNLFGDNNQGTYDNVIAVNPANPNQIFVGGIVLWEWHQGSSFTQITTGSADYDVHADLHAIEFDRKNPNIFYIGSDGGISKTSNLGQTFLTINRNYNVTQFYSVAINGTTGVMSGTQDNSCPYVSGTGIDPKKGQILYDGDGGWAAFSLLDDNAFFGTMQYADIWRSPDRGTTYQAASDGMFMSATMKGSYTPGGDAGPFITPMLIWESYNNPYSPDYTMFVADSNYNVGKKITVKSKNNRIPFEYMLTPSDGNLATGDTLMVQDIVSCHFLVGTASGIWYTRGAIQFTKTPQWINIANISNPHTMTLSKDGNYLFVGTTGGALYRISNILAISDSLSGWYNSPYSVIEKTLIKSFNGQAVTSIAVDPNNPDRILVTLGNYGNTNYVYYCSNALDASPTFISKQGTTANKKLPPMPVYSAIFEMNNPNMVIIGTEYGVYATQDITKSEPLIEWTEENNGMARVPVFAIRQQVFNYPGVTNYGAIYVGTHGKGFYKTLDYLGVNDNCNNTNNENINLSVYPNPAVDFVNIAYSLTTSSTVTIKIYDLNGRIVKSINQNKSNGNQLERIDCNDLSRGTYIVQLLTGKNSRTAKFVVTK